MPPSNVETTRAVDAVVAGVGRRLVMHSSPMIVALDGASGAGKSTLAALVADALDAAIIPSDDFFAAEIPSSEWGEYSPRERAARAIDWRRLREQALVPFLAGMPARWRAFDFQAGIRPDGSYAMQSDPVERQPRSVAILEGAYSTRPELLDLIALTVLVDAPTSVRQARLLAREDPEFLRAWHERWDAAEEYYFSHVRPPTSFDLVVSMRSARS